MEPEFVASFWTLAGNSHPRECNGISVLPLEVRAEAAAAAGFRGFSFVNTDLAAVREIPRWQQYSDIRRLLDSLDLRFVELELITDWFTTGQRKIASDKVRDLLFEAAVELGAHHIKVIGDLGSQCPLAQMVDGFGAMCRAAEKTGAKIGIELTPLTNLFTPEQGLNLVRASGASNAGLFLDVWHMGRAGIPLDSLDQIPANMIIGIELDDADLEVCGTLMHDTMTHRRLPGQGKLEPARLIAAVNRAGYRGFYGVEIVSDEHRARPVEEAARVAIQTARSQFPFKRQLPTERAS